MARKRVRVPPSHDEEHQKKRPPEVLGEESVSGDDPSPESDDDTLQNAHDVGIGLKENPENPKELDIGQDINDAEEYKKTH